MKVKKIKSRKIENDNFTELTILIPPYGLTILFNGSSVWSPTIVSKSLFIYPASCADTVDIVFVSISNTPPFAAFSFL